MAAILEGSYDPTQGTLSVGPLIISGFSDGDAIKFERAEDNYMTKVGIDGSVGRARNANKMGTATFTLKSTAQSNFDLSALLAIDDLVNDGLTVVPIAYKDGSGKDLAGATQCWIKKIPALNKGKEVTDNEWVFEAADLKIFHGGNA